jgi:hypothetical protein
MLQYHWTVHTSSVFFSSLLFLLLPVVHYLSIYGSTTLCWTSTIFFSFFIFYAVGRSPWTGDQPFTSPSPTHRTAQTQNKHTQINTSNGIRTHDPSIRAGGNSSCLRPRGHCDRLIEVYRIYFVPTVRFSSFPIVTVLSQANSE